MTKDSIQQGLTMDAAVRYLTVRAAQISEVARERHGLQGLAVQQSSEAIVASALMASQIKGDERLTIHLKAKEPSFTFLCDINAQGAIRAKFTPNILPVDSSLKINGYIVTIKHNAMRELYRGVTEFNNDSIEDGLRDHLNNSSQIDTYLRVVVEIDLSGKVTEAIGVLLERLPESPQNPSVTAQNFHAAYQRILNLSDAQLIAALNQRKLCNFDLFPLENTSLVWKCKCSQERIERMLCSLGVNELISMQKEMGYAAITCDFCNAHYHCSAEKLQLLIQLLEERGN